MFIHLGCRHWARLGGAGLVFLASLGSGHDARAQTPQWSAPTVQGGKENRPVSPAYRAPEAPASTAPAWRAPAGAAGAARTHVTGDAAVLLRLLTQPDTATATIKGHVVSAAAVREHLRAAIARRRAPVRNEASRKTEPLPSASDLAGLNQRLLASIRLPPSAEELRQVQLVSFQATSGSAPFKPVANAEMAQGMKPCPERGPGILETQGARLTPGGMVAFRADCLGAAPGEVRMYGEFPGGVIRLPVNLWTQESVAATVPADLRGVLDQAASVVVVRADGRVSNARRLSFLARRESSQLPANLVRIGGCAQQDSFCADNHVEHHASRSDGDSSGALSGSDSWRIAVGNSWVLQSAAFETTAGTITASGFEKGEPGSATLDVAWSTEQTGSMEADNSIFADLFRTILVENKIYIYEAAYSISAYATGPVGVSPDPAVKPPYSGQQRVPVPRENAATSAVQNALSDRPEQSPGTPDRVPDWGVPATNVIRGGSPASGTAFQKPFPGSRSTPQPGTPVESTPGGRR